MYRLLRPILVPLLMTSIAAAASAALWASLRDDQEARVGDLTEAVSYASRSELARSLIVQFRAFRDLSEYWATYADLPRTQWAGDGVVNLIDLVGVESIAWIDEDGPRYFTGGDSLVLDHEPTPEEWASLGDAVTEARDMSVETVIGPRFDEDGAPVFYFFRPVRRSERSGVLIAKIDAAKQLDALLLDDAPGYDLQVTCCDGTRLYARGSLHEAAPTGSSGGLIEPVNGMLWRVDLMPSEALMRTLRPWAVDAVLAVGLLMAVLFGLVVYENRRARERAAAARRAEQDVRELNRDLEHRVELRTRDLDEVLTDLNTINLSVSHDLRAPLNTINMLVYGMRQADEQDDDTKRLLDAMTRSVDRMTTITERLLGFSRAVSFQCEMERIDMQALAEQVVEEQVGPSSTTVSVRDLSPADGDRTMVHILLSNLISNALRHATPGSGPLQVEVGCEERDGVPVYYVKDNGPGISRDLTEDLFRPMPGRSSPPVDSGSPAEEKVRSARPRQGLGLGLAIAARVVRRHGGEIWVESAPGSGATFLFTLEEYAA